MWLWVSVESNRRFIPFSRPDSDGFNYPFTEDGCLLWDEWSLTDVEEEGVISGVLADYLDENRSTLLAGATGPSDPAERLDRLIQYLRDRCVRPVGV
jgi:hypothetical protein